MIPLDFDFHVRAARPGKLGITLLLAGAVALAWVWTQLQAARATDAGVAAQVAALEHARARPALKPTTRRDAATQSAFAGLKAQLAFSWQPAFDALATAASPTIALRTLEASQAKSQIKLEAEARRLADAIAYVEVLQQQPGVRRAALIQHAVQTDFDQKPVRFRILIELES
jgi:hypothetical protein